MSRERHWVGDLRALAAGQSDRPVIDLSVGQPDGDPPGAALAAVGAADAQGHVYPAPLGASSLREAAAAWCQARYGVPLAARQVAVSHGAKLLVALAPLAYTQPGDVVVVPTPGYPTYAQSVRLLGRQVRWLTLRPESGWLPSPVELEASFSGARMAYLSYPANPTGAAGGADVLAEAVSAARRSGTGVVHDAAYAELRHDGRREVALAVPGAEDVVVELFSFSKTFHLAGYRVGFAAALGELLEPLAAVLGVCDTGASRVAQRAAEAALRQVPDFAEGRRERDRRRTQRVAEGLGRLGCRVTPPEAAFYVWFRPPEAALDAGLGWEAVVREAGIACAPGEAFGPAGAGYIRFACVRDEAELDEAVERLARLWA